MIDEHPNAAKMREAATAFSSGNLDAMFNALDDDIVWHAGGDNRLSGTFVGRDQLMGWFGAVMVHSRGTAQVTVEDVLADDKFVMAYLRIRASEPTVLDQIHVNAIRVGPTGRFDELWYLPDDMAAWDTFVGS